MKIHEWLSTCGSHDIYDAVAIGADFKKETGKEPCWPVHTAAATRAAIKARGLGGSLKENKPCAYGYEIAESLADTYTDSRAHHRFNGRGSRFWAALDALKHIDI